MEINYKDEQCFKILATKDIAQEWLNHNYSNRAISEKYLKTLIKEIRENKWVINGDTIRFSKTGELLDGQHRLTAIVKTGIPQYVWVFTGLDKTSHIDDGRGRTIRDQILVSGKAKKGDAFSDNKCIATVRYLYNYSRNNNGYYQEERPSTDDVLLWMQLHSDSINFIKKLADIHGGSVNARSAFILAAALVCQMNGVSEEDITDWFRVVRTGEYSSDLQLSGIAFRNYLINMKSSHKESGIGFLKAQHSIRVFNHKKCRQLNAKTFYPFTWNLEET